MAGRGRCTPTKICTTAMVTSWPMIARLRSQNRCPRLTRPVMVIRCITPVYLLGVVRHTVLSVDITIERLIALSPGQTHAAYDFRPRPPCVGRLPDFPSARRGGAAKRRGRSPGHLD